MTRDFRNHLLLQVEMLRAGISHEELSNKLGPLAERHLAAYIAGKAHLMEEDFKRLAHALSKDAQTLAEQWAISLGLGLNYSRRTAAECMLRKAYREHQRFGRKVGVPSTSLTDDGHQGQIC
jgi:cyanate lyase